MPNLLAQVGKTGSSVWVGVAVFIYIVFKIVAGARSEERRRQLENQPHTLKDNLLLLFSGLVILGILLSSIFFKEVHFLTSPLGMFGIFLVIPACLTYLFNRKTGTKSHRIDEFSDNATNPRSIEPK